MTDPTHEWTYRNFLCRIYELGSITQIGFVRVGDEWTQVHQTNDVDADIHTYVESEVDTMITKAVREEVGRFDFPPNPRDPRPPADPPKPPQNDPIWMQANGVVEVNSSRGGTELVDLADLDADDLDDEGRYDGEKSKRGGRTDSFYNLWLSAVRNRKI